MCVPLHVGGECVGLLNVGSPDDVPLGQHDYNAILAVADRLRVALELRREQEELTARGKRFRQLVRLAAVINHPGTGETFPSKVAEAVSDLIPADATALSLEARNGRYVIRGATGEKIGHVGSEVTHGASTVRTALEGGRIVVTQAETGAWEAAVPLVLDGRTIGAVEFLRRDPDRPFTHLEREAMPLIADQVAMASRLVVADPSAGVGLVDPATGLRSREAFDDAFAIVTAWQSTGVSLFLLEPEIDEGISDPVRRKTLLEAALTHIGRAASNDGPGTFAGRHGETTVVIAGGSAADPTTRVAELRRAFMGDAPDGVVGLWAGVGVASAAAEAARLVQNAEAALALARRAGLNATVRL